MTIKVGERLPDAVFKTKSDEGVSEVRSDALFKGKRIVLFAVPGAFTPTCSMNHLPGYLENRDAILAKGIDAIVVVAVNDPHVMGAWAKATNGEGKIQYLSDGNATFTKAVGLDVDLGAGNMGIRSKRYSMLVEDGVVKQLNIEEVSWSGSHLERSYHSRSALEQEHIGVGISLGVNPSLPPCCYATSLFKRG